MKDPDATGSFKKRKAIFEGGIYGEEGRGKEIPRPPCQCMEADHIGEPGTCYQYGTGHNVRCGRPAKGTIKMGGGYGGDDYEIEVCGIHLNAYRVKKATNARWDAEWEARREKYAKKEANSRASEMWAERLKEEFGLPTSVLHDSLELRVKLSPEEAYKILDEIRTMLDEVYEDHPFRFATVEDL